MLLLLLKIHSLKRYGTNKRIPVCPLNGNKMATEMPVEDLFSRGVLKTHWNNCKHEMTSPDINKYLYHIFSLSVFFAKTIGKLLSKL